MPTAPYNPAQEWLTNYATCTRSQFVRIPDGLRENGTRQCVFYFHPGKAVKL